MRPLVSAPRHADVAGSGRQGGGGVGTDRTFMRHTGVAACRPAEGAHPKATTIVFSWPVRWLRSHGSRWASRARAGSLSVRAEHDTCAGCKPRTLDRSAGIRFRTGATRPNIHGGNRLDMLRKGTPTCLSRSIAPRFARTGRFPGATMCPGLPNGPGGRRAPRGQPPVAGSRLKRGPRSRGGLMKCPQFCATARWPA